MFEQMEIAGNIYESDIEPPYKKNTRADANRANHSRQKRGKTDSSKCNPIWVNGLTSTRKYL